MNALVKIFLVLAVIELCRANCTDSTESADDIHERSKRWLTFQPNGGTAKIVLGCVFPVRWGHNIFKALNMALNLQANYQIPAKIIWPVPEGIFKNRLNEDYVDNSRKDLYRLLESMFNKAGSNGQECVLRTICEVAEAPLEHNGMLGEILDVIFTPNDSDPIDESYKQAKLQGLNGTDCTAAYKGCPIGFGVLEKMSFLHLLK